MNPGVTGFPVMRVRAAQAAAGEDTVVRERPYTLLLNDRELVTLVCSPLQIKELAVGFLCAEGILRKRGDL